MSLVVSQIMSLVAELTASLVIRLITSLVTISSTSLAIHLLGCLYLAGWYFSHVSGHGANYRNIYIFSHRPHAKHQTIEGEIYSRICIEGKWLMDY